MTVVRLKDGLKNRPKEHYGTRTDYLCARSLVYQPDWHFNSPKWVEYYRQYSSRKPSTGLCAVFCAIDHLNPKEIHLIGFDRVLNPDDSRWDHDQLAENACIHSLGIRIIDLGNLP